MYTYVLAYEVQWSIKGSNILFYMSWYVLLHSVIIHFCFHRKQGKHAAFVVLTLFSARAYNSCASFFNLAYS